MKILFTDLELLQAIYKLYKKDYISLRENSFYIPICCKEIAKEIDSDAEIVFNRLYHHLEQTYKTTHTEGNRITTKSLFRFDEHSINYPYLCSILAKLQDDNKKIENTFNIACFSLFIAILALFL